MYMYEMGQLCVTSCDCGSRGGGVSGVIFCRACFMLRWLSFFSSDSYRNLTCFNIPAGTYLEEREETWVTWYEIILILHIILYQLIQLLGDWVCATIVILPEGNDPTQKTCTDQCHTCTQCIATAHTKSIDIMKACHTVCTVHIQHVHIMSVEYWVNNTTLRKGHLYYYENHLLLLYF